MTEENYLTLLKITETTHLFPFAFLKRQGKTGDKKPSSPVIKLALAKNNNYYNGY